MKTINEDIFPRGLKLDTLFIGGNYLNFLSNEVLKKISVKTLELYGNPWKCPCLDRINYWLFETNGTTYSPEICTTSKIPICVYPKSYSKTCIEVADDEVNEMFLETLNTLTDAVDALKYCVNTEKLTLL